MKIKLSATTDIGRDHTKNEDNYIVCSNLFFQNWAYKTIPHYISLGKYGALAVLADGMGGVNAGDIASAIVVNTIRNEFAKDKIANCLEAKAMSILEFLQNVVVEANVAIKNKIMGAPDTAGMGTTVVLLWIFDKKAYIVWCGDSRCYVFNPHTGLRCITKDHSYVQELIDKQEITVEQSYSHPDNNVITKCLDGSISSSLPDSIVYDVSPNDTFLLCSDGLCGYCRDKNIEKVMFSNIYNLNKCCNELNKIAFDSGGVDDVTIILASVIENEATEIKIPMMYKIRKFLGF